RRREKIPVASPARPWTPVTPMRPIARWLREWSQLRRQVRRSSRRTQPTGLPPEVGNHEHAHRGGERGVAARPRHLVADLIYRPLFPFTDFLESLPECGLEPHAGPMAVDDDIS